jgi:hypothetical protein
MQLHPCRKEDTCYIGYTPAEQWTATPLEDTGYAMQLHPCRKTHATLATPLQEESRQLHP